MLVLSLNTRNNTESCLKEKSSVVSAAVFFVASVSMNSMLWVGKRRVKTAWVISGVNVCNLLKIVVCFLFNFDNNNWSIKINIIFLFLDTPVPIRDSRFAGDPFLLEPHSRERQSRSSIIWTMIIFWSSLTSANWTLKWVLVKLKRLLYLMLGYKKFQLSQFLQLALVAHVAALVPAIFRPSAEKIIVWRI